MHGLIGVVIFLTGVFLGLLSVLCFAYCLRTKRQKPTHIFHVGDSVVVKRGKMRIHGVFEGLAIDSDIRVNVRVGGRLDNVDAACVELDEKAPIVRPVEPQTYRG